MSCKQPSTPLSSSGFNGSLGFATGMPLVSGGSLNSLQRQPQTF